jgi:hydrogenase/urease accessory protein HupE
MRTIFILLAMAALPAQAHHEGHAHSLAAGTRHGQLGWDQLLVVAAGLLALAGLCLLLGFARAWRSERDRRRQLRVQALVPFVGRSHGSHID